VLLQNRLLPAKLAGCAPARIWLPLTDSGATSASAGVIPHNVISASQRVNLLAGLASFPRYMAISFLEEWAYI
jgi:hypothetical protein